MSKIITISRQYASGGRTIGMQVAKKLGIDFYDSAIVKETMKKTGLAQEIVEATEQRITNSFLFNLVMGVDISHNNIKQIEKAEHEIIQNFIDKGSCVIVGRSANFISSDKDDVLNVYIYSDIKNRIDYAVKNYNIDEKQAKQIIEQSDKERSLYASNFYGKDWGNKLNYSLMLNSGLLGIEKCVDIICAAIERGGKNE